MHALPEQGKKLATVLIIEVAIGQAGNLYSTYVEGLGQVPDKKYTILYRTSCRTNSHFI